MCGCTRSAQLTETGRHVGRPDLPVVIFVNAPDVLVGREAKRGRCSNLLEHTPTSANPTVPARLANRWRTRPVRPFHGSATFRHRLPSQLYVPVDDGPHRAATVLDDSGDRFEPFEARCRIAARVRREFDRCSLDSPTRPRGHRLSPR